MFYVESFLRYATHSLCDGQTTTGYGAYGIRQTNCKYLDAHQQREWNCDEDEEPRDSQEDVSTAASATPTAIVLIYESRKNITEYYC